MYRPQRIRYTASVTGEFELMKDTAYLINTARGSIVDEPALIRALEAKNSGRRIRCIGKGAA